MSDNLLCAACGSPLVPALISLEPWWDDGGHGGMRRLGRCRCGAVTLVDDEVLPADLPRLVRCGDGRMTTSARLADVVAWARVELADQPQRWARVAVEAGVSERAIRAWIEDGIDYMTSGNTLAISAWAWAHCGTTATESEVGVEEGAQICGQSVDSFEALLANGTIRSRLLDTGCRLIRRADVIAWRDIREHRGE